MPSSAGAAHRTPRRQLSATTPSTQASSTNKWVPREFSINFIILIVLSPPISNVDGPTLTATSRRVLNNRLEFNRSRRVPFAKRWSNWVSRANQKIISINQVPARHYWHLSVSNFTPLLSIQLHSGRWLSPETINGSITFVICANVAIINSCMINHNSPPGHCSIFMHILCKQFVFAQRNFQLTSPDELCVHEDSKRTRKLEWSLWHLASLPPLLVFTRDSWVSKLVHVAQHITSAILVRNQLSTIDICNSIVSRHLQLENYAQLIIILLLTELLGDYQKPRKF